CGNESLSGLHIRGCNIASLTVIHKKDTRVLNRSDTEMDCPEPECQFRTRSVYSWLDHLRKA
ncbi:hypothetical protein PENTCL1PPCAC_8446, partial [Pristionchus entomophagus]